MVGPTRPMFVLFGSSIVQFSYGVSGWGAILSDYYSRKEAATQPALVIVYFGGNDACHPDFSAAHVPLPEYYENMKKLAAHLKGLSETIRVIFLTPPPVNEKTIAEYFREEKGRTNAAIRMYADACLKVCTEMEVTAIDLWGVFQQRDDWLSACFTDGIHLSAEGSKMVADEILKVLKEAEWEPSLYWKMMPFEFPGFVDQDPYGYHHFLRSGSRL
ncbi:GDSL esterase/lipase At2g38180 [Linum grandiflorum]